MVVNDREPAVFCLAGGGWVGGPPPSCLTGTSLLYHNVLAYRNTHTISSVCFKDHHLPSYLNLQMSTCPFQISIRHFSPYIFPTSSMRMNVPGILHMLVLQRAFFYSVFFIRHFIFLPCCNPISRNYPTAIQNAQRQELTFQVTPNDWIWYTKKVCYKKR